MNIEELFTLSGTGLVIGALLSWLSLAFTARRIPASAAQTQPNSRQPLSSGGKALRVFSLAAALLALIGLGWGLLDRWRLVHVADEYGLVSLLSDRHFL